MKLRIRGDSIRLRLTQSEVAALAEDGRVEESIAFGPSARLTYAIAFGGSTLTAKFADALLEISVPADVARAWASGDSVGFEAAQDAGGGRTLRILVEKDFACLTERPNEDDTDAFRNPRSSC
ncbi:MAG TPA: hypothetical protein VM925_14270 [Labilithrix sp.]|nr:hypothetical protein [Labilithrix sp.]